LELLEVACPLDRSDLLHLQMVRMWSSSLPRPDVTTQRLTAGTLVDILKGFCELCLACLL